MKKYNIGNPPSGITKDTRTGKVVLMDRYKNEKDKTIYQFGGSKRYNKYLNEYIKLQKKLANNN